mmetsp:Transcript_15708/g.41398  ORF Transcript_15708/g.41398 Transcript_15708/m.41398 type:complete len:238 (-) Transcript_15708:1923-2636(-)
MGGHLEPVNLKLSLGTHSSLLTFSCPGGASSGMQQGGWYLAFRTKSLSARTDRSVWWRSWLSKMWMRYSCRNRGKPCTGDTRGSSMVTNCRPSCSHEGSKGAFRLSSSESVSASRLILLLVALLVAGLSCTVLKSASVAPLMSTERSQYLSYNVLAVENSFSFTVQCERSSCLNEGGGGASSPALAFLAKASPRVVCLPDLAEGSGTALFFPICVLCLVYIAAFISFKVHIIMLYFS